MHPGRGVVQIARRTARAPASGLQSARLPRTAERSARLGTARCEFRGRAASACGRACSGRSQDARGVVAARESEPGSRRMCSTSSCSRRDRLADARSAADVAGDRRGRGRSGRGGRPGRPRARRRGSRRARWRCAARGGCRASVLARAASRASGVKPVEPLGPSGGRRRRAGGRPGRAGRTASRSGGSVSSTTLSR